MDAKDAVPEFELPLPAEKKPRRKTALRVSLSLVDQGVISLSNFLAALYLARLISPTEFGIYAVGFALLRFVRALQDGLIVQPENTSGAGMTKDEFRHFLSSTLLFQLAFTVLVSLGTLLFGYLLTAWGKDNAGPALYRLWFVFITWPLQEFLRRAFYTRGEIAKAAILSTTANLARFAFLIWITGEGRLSGSAGMDAIGYGALVGLLFGIWGARDYFSFRLNWAKVRSTWRENWLFGRWMLGALLANYVALEVYPLVVAGMISFAATGAYRALVNLVAPVHVILRAMDTFITPYTARSLQNSGKKHLFRIVQRAYLFGGVPIVVILALASVFTGPLLKLLYGETYLGVQSGMLWLGLFYLLWYAYWPVQSALKAMKLSEPVFHANLAAIVCMFSFGLIAIRVWGLNGAFIGQSLNAIIINLVLWSAWLKIKRAAQLESVQD